MKRLDIPAREINMFHKVIKIEMSTLLLLITLLIPSGNAIAQNVDPKHIDKMESKPETSVQDDAKGENAMKFWSIVYNSKCPRNIASFHQLQEVNSRGFDGADYIKGCKKYTHLGIEYPELVPFGTKIVKPIIVGLELGLNNKELYNLIQPYLTSNISLTESYNENVVGGNSLIYTGAGLLILGVITGIAGGFIHDRGNNNVIEEGPRDVVFGLLMMAIGGAGTLAGIPLLTVGKIRKGKWLKKDLLDKGSSYLIRQINK